MAGVLVTPLRSRTGISRHITPSPEKKSKPGNILFISPTKRAKHDHRSSSTEESHRQDTITPNFTFSLNSVRGAVPAELKIALSRASEIVFDDFSLVENGGMRFLNGDRGRMILSLFPTAVAYRQQYPLLVIQVEVLPPKPWPIAIAGMPLFVTTSEKDMGFDHGKLGGAPGILWELKGKINDNLRMIADYTIDHLSKVDIKVEELGWFFLFFRIKLATDVERSKLPRAIAGLRCSYVVEVTDVVSRREAALRRIIPQGELRDDSTYYPNLRPGVMVSDGGSPHERLTTSGIAVRDCAGNPFVTVAKHGFPGGIGSLVHHPTTNGKVIGKIAAAIPNSDIGLMAPITDLRYSSENFGHVDEDGQLLNPGPTIAGIVPLDDSKVFWNWEVLMNNPFSGYCQGFFEGTGFSVDRGGQVSRMSFVYFGNGRDEEMGGSCGSPIILKENGKVLAFYQFLDKDGWAYGSMAGKLLEAGYSVIEL